MSGSAIHTVNHGRFLPGSSFDIRHFFFAFVYRLDECDGEPCNLLDDDYLDQVSQLERHLAENVEVRDDAGLAYRYDSSSDTAATSLCLSYAGRCQHRIAGEFGPISLIKQRRQLRDSFGITVQYPQTLPPRAAPVYLAWNLGGVWPQNGSEIQRVLVSPGCG